MERVKGASTSRYIYDVIGNVARYLDPDNGSGDGTSFVQEGFGNVLSGSQSGYHLTTKEYDPDSDLYYFWARWYNPKLGIFTSKDPFEFVLYSFEAFVDSTTLPAKPSRHLSNGPIRPSSTLSTTLIKFLKPPLLYERSFENRYITFSETALIPNARTRPC